MREVSWKCLQELGPGWRAGCFLGIQTPVWGKGCASCCKLSGNKKSTWNRGALASLVLGTRDNSSVAVIVVVIVPIALVVPAVLVFVPPTMRVLPAIGACFGEFVAPMIRLGTLPTVVLDGFVQLVISVNDALLTVVVGMNDRRQCEKKGNGDCQAHEDGTERRHFEAHVFSRAIWFVRDSRA